MINRLKMPIWLKVMIGGIPIILVIVYMIILNNSGNSNRKLFYLQGFSATVVSCNKYQGREMELHLSNGLKLYFGLTTNNIVSISDLIIKEPNTYNYKVYRVNLNGEYKYWTTYNFDGTL